MARYTGAFVQDCLSGFRRPSLPHRTASEAVEKRFLERTSGLRTGGKPQRLAGL